MHKFIRIIGLFLATLTIFAAPARADVWTTTPWTPVWDTSVTWTPPYGVDSPHPMDAYEPASILGPITASDWETTQNQRGGIGTSPEGKFRTNCQPSFTARADPILGPGIYPFGHGHTFFGWMGLLGTSGEPSLRSQVQNFTYAMGRNNPASACAGGPRNSTLYWEPSIYSEQFAGVRLVVIPDFATFYYTHDPQVKANTTRLRRGLRFIGGADPSNFNDTARRLEYAAAGLVYPGSPSDPAGKLGIICYPEALGLYVPAPVYGDARMQFPDGTRQPHVARYAVGPGGSDPWQGGCTKGFINLLVDAPNCQDPNSLSSPNGRDHFRYGSRKADSSWGGCPSNAVLVMAFSTHVQVTTKGWAKDMKHWYLSSDRMRMPTTECPDAANPCDGVSGGNVPGTVGGIFYSRVSLDDCRRVSLDFCALSTIHFDWFGAPETVFFEGFQRDCGGLTIHGVTTNHADCGNGGFTDNKSLLGVGTPPVLNLSTNPIYTNPQEIPGMHSTNSTEGKRYFPVNPADQSQGPLIVNHEGHGGH